MRFRSRSLSAAIGLLLIANVATAQTRYEVLDLTELSAVSEATPKSINNSGVIAGSIRWRFDDRNTIPSLWVDARLRPSTPLAGHEDGEMAKVNDSGIAVGYSAEQRTESGVPLNSKAVAYLGSCSHAIERVAERPPWSLRKAQAINDIGWIAGIGAGGIFLFDGTSVRDLGLPGGSYTIVTALNDAGQLIGTKQDLLTRGFLYEDGTRIDLPGYTEDCPAWVKDINELGDIVGYGEITPLDIHALLWRGGEVIDLGSPEGRNSGANAINDRGEIVGTSIDDTYKPRPYLWRDGLSISIADRLVNGSDYTGYGEATDINDRGQIVGVLEKHDQGELREHGVVLTPVDLVLTNLIPGQAGEVNELLVSGLEPGAIVELVFGNKVGMSEIPDSDSLGAPILISRPKHVARLVADEVGTIVFAQVVPERFRGRKVRIQAYATRGGEVSNTIDVRFD